MLHQNNWLEINARALDHNIATYKQIIGNAQLGLVVKGNAYGHGLDEIISLTKNNELISWYCTAHLSEALRIRALACNKPILVFYPIDNDPVLAMQQNIDLVIYDPNQLSSIIHNARQHNLVANIHLKIDTGLSRFGFLPDIAYTIMEQLQDNSHIQLKGILTHFADAEIQDQSFTDWQMEQFNQLITKLNTKNIHIPYMHAFASSATLSRPLDSINLVRIGAGIYGLWPSKMVKDCAQKKHNIDLIPVLSWKTRIMSTRIIETNQYIGYGRTFKTTRPMRIGLLPIGYADGYHRRLSNVGKVLVDGKLAPVIGRTAMNCITIDITDAPKAQINSIVTLLGNHPGITAYDLAQQIESYNPREIVTRLAAHIPKKVVEETILPYKTKQSYTTSSYKK